MSEIRLALAALKRSIRGENCAIARPDFEGFIATLSDLRR